MNKILSILILLFTSTLCQGAEKYFVVPVNSPFKYSHDVEEKLEDHFKGTATLTGKLVFERFPYDDIKEVVVSFVPDTKTKEVLPYKSALGKVKSVGISGEKEKYAALLSEEQKQKLFAGSYPSIELQVSIIVSDYYAEVSCDNTYYWLSIVRILKSNERPKPSKVKPSVGSCQ